MQADEKFETVMYSQKRAHKLWLAKASENGVTPSDELAELVWELLVSYGEAVEGYQGSEEDIYKSAYDLAVIALRELPIQKIMAVYRDCLVNAMIDALGRNAREQYKTLIDFTGNISTAFCAAHSDLLKRTIRHGRAERFSDELKVAKSIQSHLLPKVIPEIPGFQFAGRLVPAEEVGGDYWSIKYYPEDDIVTLKLADISGHGVAAATLVAAVKFISGGYYRGSNSAAEVIYQTNRVLTKETPYDILVTMAYAWLRPSTYELSVVNAGHEPVFICGNNRCIDIHASGPVLGVSGEVNYQEKTFKLTKGDVLFFGSDGITEAGLVHPFGVERLRKLVIDNSHLDANDIADLVIRTVREYVKQPHDDISLLVVKVTGEPPEA